MIRAVRCVFAEVIMSCQDLLVLWAAPAPALLSYCLDGGIDTIMYGVESAREPGEGEVVSIC